MNDTVVTISGKLDLYWHEADDTYTYSIVSDCGDHRIFWQFTTSVKLTSKMVEVRGFPYVVFQEEEATYIGIEAEVIEELE